MSFDKLEIYGMRSKINMVSNKRSINVMYRSEQYS